MQRYIDTSKMTCRSIIQILVSLDWWMIRALERQHHVVLSHMQLQSCLQTGEGLLMMARKLISGACEKYYKSLGFHFGKLHIAT